MDRKGSRRMLVPKPTLDPDIRGLSNQRLTTIDFLPRSIAKITDQLKVP